MLHLLEICFTVNCTWGWVCQKCSTDVQQKLIAMEMLGCRLLVLLEVPYSCRELCHEPRQASAELCWEASAGVKVKPKPSSSLPVS